MSAKGTQWCDTAPRLLILLWPSLPRFSIILHPYRTWCISRSRDGISIDIETWREIGCGALDQSDGSPHPLTRGTRIMVNNIRKNLVLCLSRISLPLKAGGSPGPFRVRETTIAFLRTIRAILVAIDSQAIVEHRHDHWQGLKLYGTTKHFFSLPKCRHLNPQSNWGKLLPAQPRGSTFAQLDDYSGSNPLHPWVYLQVLTFASVFCAIISGTFSYIRFNRYSHHGSSRAFAIIISIPHNLIFSSTLYKKLSNLFNLHILVVLLIRHHTCAPLLVTF